MPTPFPFPSPSPASALALAAEQAAALISQADALIVAAGAGMGVDSGLPDFRGTEGFWRAYPALRNSGVDFSSIASPSTFESAPALAWGFYGHRLALYRRTLPHAGFALLKHWGERMPQGYSVFTSNVDGQFQKAGFDLARIHECHGSIHHLQCLVPCRESVWSAGDFKPAVDDVVCRLTNTAPTCPKCGALARPNLMMFHDTGWVEARTDAQSDRQEVWLASVKRPVVIELGAGTTIPSVRYFSQRVVDELGGSLVRINPYQSGVPAGQGVALAAGASAGLAAIGRALGEGWALPSGRSTRTSLSTRAVRSDEGSKPTRG